MNQPSLPKHYRIFVAGHRGMVGSAIFQQLEKNGYSNIVTQTREHLDLIDQRAVQDFFQNERIDAVFLAAAKVGGIRANNTYPANFIYNNLMIQCNVIHAAYTNGVQRLLFLGSSCIYPRHCPQPMREEYLLNGYLEPTNEPYALSKIAGIKLCESYNRQYGTKYRCVMPTNLYGPYDNFDLESSHVLPAMLRKFHLAKLAKNEDWQAIDQDEKKFGPIPADIQSDLKMHSSHSATPVVRLWGTGRPRREFLHVDDMASACLFVMQLSDENYKAACTSDTGTVSHLNVGCGADISIAQLAGHVGKTVHFSGKIVWDDQQPDGTPRKLLDVSRLNQLGWTPNIDLMAGIQSTYDWYCKN